MSYRITSANGLTVAPNEEIVSEMRKFTTLNGSDNSINPFKPKRLVLSCDIQTAIKINGENPTTLRLNSDSKYEINLGYYDVIVKTIEIVENAVTWEATFLF